MSMVQRIGRGLLLRQSQWPVSPTSTRAAAGAVNYFHASRIARWGETKTTTRKTSTTSTETATATTKQTKNWADPESRQYKFWNREDDAKAAGKYSFLIEMSPESILKEARIISLSDPWARRWSALARPSRPLMRSVVPTCFLSVPAVPTRQPCCPKCYASSETRSNGSTCAVPVLTLSNRTIWWSCAAPTAAVVVVVVSSSPMPRVSSVHHWPSTRSWPVRTLPRIYHD
jgi:hypothetical protein